MANRMAVSQHKYGSIDDTVAKRGSYGLKNIYRRLEKYEETGNTEWLADAANYCIIEGIFPGHSEAHFRSTDSDESPGIV